MSILPHLAIVPVQPLSQQFLAPYIIAGIRAHLEMTANLPPVLQITALPQGALALATVAVRCMFLQCDSHVTCHLSF